MRSSRKSGVSSATTVEYTMHLTHETTKSNEYRYEPIVRARALLQASHAVGLWDQ